MLREHVLNLATEVLRKILDLSEPSPNHGSLLLVGHLPPLTRGHPLQLYRLLHQASVEAEAAWSLLADSGDGTRIFSIRAALVPMALPLIEKDGAIIVLDLRIPTQR